MYDTRKARRKRRSVLPFKECASRYGDVVVLLQESAPVFMRDDTDECVFRKLDLYLDQGDVIVPLELVSERSYFAIRCMTKYGVVFVTTTIHVKSI